MGPFQSDFLLTMHYFIVVVKNEFRKGLVCLIRVVGYLYVLGKPPSPNEVFGLVECKCETSAP